MSDRKGGATKKVKYLAMIKNDFNWSFLIVAQYFDGYIYIHKT